MVYIRIKEILKKQGKSKYWLMKQLDGYGGYQNMSRMMDNQTISIRFDTIDKLCEILNCEPGELFGRK